jgi:hypothetical protein
MKITPRFTNILLIFTGIIWLVIDIIIAINQQWTSTISYRLWSASDDFLFIPYGFGVLMSHFFAPNYFKKIAELLRRIIWISVSSMMFIYAVCNLYLYPGHKFIYFIIGLGVGLLWVQDKIND